MFHEHNKKKERKEQKYFLKNIKYKKGKRISFHFMTTFFSTLICVVVKIQQVRKSGFRNLQAVSHSDKAFNFII